MPVLVSMLVCSAWLAGCGAGSATTKRADRSTPPPLVGIILANPARGSLLLGVNNAERVRACFALPATFSAGRRQRRASTACRRAALLHVLPAGYPAQANLASVFKDAVWMVPIPHDFSTVTPGWHFRVTATGHGGTVTSTVFAAHYPPYRNSSSAGTVTG